MYIETLCAPAVLFIMILIIQVIFEVYKKDYPMALVKFICCFVIIMFLQLLCVANMELLSWIIVFLPLIIYTYMTVLLYFVFGINSSKTLKQFEVK